MSILANSVLLIGRLGKDVAIKTFESGSKKATFSLATTKTYKNPKGEYVKDTQWHNIVAWGRNADLFSKSLIKGNKVAIQGTLNYRTYEATNGQTKYITEVLVTDFMKMNSEPKSPSLN